MLKKTSVFSTIEEMALHKMLLKQSGGIKKLPNKAIRVLKTILGLAMRQVKAFRRTTTKRPSGFGKQQIRVLLKRNTALLTAIKR